MSDLQFPSRRNLRKRKKPFLVLGSIALVVLVIGVSLYANRSGVRSLYEQITGAEYSGQGTGSAEVIVSRGDVGIDIAKKLVAADVTKSYEITLRAIFSRNPTFFPGTYKIPTQISADKAISYLVDPRNAITNTVTLREGLRIGSVFQKLSDASGVPVADFKTAARKLSSFDLPKEANSLEGYLFPATYSFDLSYSATDMLKAMVSRTKQQLESDGVKREDWHKVLTLASIIQMEARQQEDFYKVSRVFQNRIKIGMHLQSDATVSYGVDGDTVNTSVADRSDPNLYNTYKYPGLPIGPIAGAGALAIDAALNPAEGSWLYFVAVNLETGETVFSNTFAEHEAAVLIWGRWMRENPGWDD
jgi:UPF0755 protein